MNSFDVFVIKGFTVLNHTKRIPQILNLGLFILIGSKVWENLKSLFKGHFFQSGAIFRVGSLPYTRANMGPS